jgi:pimeloyl-ACP methyl ester carboxylesterase
VRASISHDGFAGLYYAPPKPRKPAILLFGGSEGGLQTGFLAATLAAQGFPTLAIAYFGYPGLPKILHHIPLEYFAKALRWLDRQPGVDPQHVFLLGISRGSEAAQLLGVHFPQLVHGVVAVVPSDYVNECFGTLSCSGSGWSLGGKPLAFTGVGFPKGVRPTRTHAYPTSESRRPFCSSAPSRTLSGPRAATRATRSSTSTATHTLTS